MKVQELFEAKKAAGELDQEDFERNTMLPAVAVLLGADKAKDLGAGVKRYSAGLRKPAKTKTLKWKDPDGFESVYDLYLFNVDGTKIVKVEYNDYGGGTDPMYYVAKTAKVTEAVGMSPSALRNTIKKHLKQMDFTVASEETTKGALKTWFDVVPTRTEIPTLRGIAKVLKKELPDQDVKYMSGKVFGKGFNLEQEIPFEGGDGLYLAVFNKGADGDHHRMGVDN